MLKKRAPEQQVMQQRNVLEKRKLQSAEQVSQQVSKIAKIFDKREKMLVDVRKSLEHHNTQMIKVVIATTEELQKNEITRSLTKAVTNFLRDNSKGGEKESEVENDMSTLKSSLELLALSRDKQADLAKQNITDTVMVHSLVDKCGLLARETATAGGRLSEVARQLEKLKASQLSHLQGMETQRETIKLQTVEAANLKKTLEGRLQKEKVALSSLEDEVASLMATIAALEQETEQSDKMRGHIATITCSCDAAHDRLTALREGIQVAAHALTATAQLTKQCEEDISTLHQSVTEKKAAHVQLLAALGTATAQEEALRGDVALAQDGRAISLRDSTASTTQEYHQQLTRLQEVSAAHKSDLDAQSGAIRELQQERQLLHAAHKVAAEGLEGLRTTLETAVHDKEQQERDCREQALRADKVKTEADGWKEKVNSLEAQCTELSLEKTAKCEQAAHALLAQVTGLLRCREEHTQHLQDEAARLAVNESAAQSYLAMLASEPNKRAGRGQDGGGGDAVLSTAARGALVKQVDESVTRILDDLNASYQQQKEEKERVLLELRGRVRLQQREEQQNLKILEWKQRLGSLQSRIDRLLCTDISSSSSSGGGGGGGGGMDASYGVQDTEAATDDDDGGDDAVGSQVTMSRIAGAAGVLRQQQQQHAKHAKHAKHQQGKASTATATAITTTATTKMKMASSSSVVSSPSSGYASPSSFIEGKRKAAAANAVAPAPAANPRSLAFDTSTTVAASTSTTSSGGIGIRNSKKKKVKKIKELDLSLSLKGDWFDDFGQGW
jgi:chromosome segregation ATPase